MKVFTSADLQRASSEIQRAANSEPVAISVQGRPSYVLHAVMAGFVAFQNGTNISFEDQVFFVSNFRTHVWFPQRLRDPMQRTKARCPSFFRNRRANVQS